MTDNEYYHEMTMDVPNPDTSIKHKTMRFVKVREADIGIAGGKGESRKE